MLGYQLVPGTIIRPDLGFGRHFFPVAARVLEERWYENHCRTINSSGTNDMCCGPHHADIINAENARPPMHLVPFTRFASGPRSHASGYALHITTRELVCLFNDWK